ncbi:lantibiotic dehydratase [Micromonospora marina]|uniref:Lantibiotic dehydratase, C terminus n=1 Tax=Micromonospora marina TaxID=307120 RepID=A0A1C5AJH5_9ACTN|nr:lantibiotic dehydratase [Micromonospora marina]SCF45402.1 Lantibiotic dehydratase, C terminus [Micromonospora marina]
MTPTGLPPHLADLASDEWAIWRWSCLRSAGFPLTRLAALSDAPAAAAADRLNDARDDERQAYLRALAVVRGCLDDLREADDWDSPRRRPLLRAMKALRRGRSLPEGIPTDIVAAADVHDAARRAVGRARAELERTWVEARARTSAATADLVADDRIAEAIVWQNREAFQTVVAPLRRDGTGGSYNQTRRRREELIARYAQRYCAKNDSIGYFGPISWARFLDTGPALTAVSGPGLIRDRRVNCEQWGIDALAEAIGGLPNARRWARPRLLPFAHRTEDVVQPSGSPPIHLSPGQAAALAACDGKRSARDVAALALAAEDPTLRDEEEVYAFLADLTNRGITEWHLEVPFVTAPERELSALLDGIDDDRLQPVARRMLQVYQSAIGAVAASAGTVEPLYRSLETADRIFTRLTGQPAVRGHGQMYAARAIVYEDCTRDLDVELGPEIRTELGVALVPLLQSLRWFSVRAAQLAHTGLLELFHELRADGPETYVPAARLWQVLPRLFPGLGSDRQQAAPFVTDLRDEFQRRWEQVLDLDSGQRVVQRDAASVRAAVARVFPAERPGWGYARYHSPDVLVAAADVAAVERGEYTLVLGEMHAANNTLAAAGFADNHTAPGELSEYVAWDLPTRVVATVAPRVWPGVTSSTRDALRRPTDVQLLMSHEFAEPSVPVENQVAISDLVIEEIDGVLRARTFDRRVDLPAVELVGELLSTNVVDVFGLSTGRSHTPRVQIGRLVAQRESWRFPLAELRHLTGDGEVDRFVASRGFARHHGLPERVFVKLPTEQKPLYLDFTSPILVNIMVKGLRRALEHGPVDGSATFTEMLPTGSQSWLRDGDQQPYTSEFRTVIVDLAGRDEPAADAPARG